MRILIFSLLFSVTTSLTAQEDEIRAVLTKQTECWNTGDLECFMDTYLKSDDLVYVGSSGPKYGWAVTLNNYKRSYPNRDAMGTLSFELLKFIPLGRQHHLVIGKWSLQRKSDNPTGHFSLVFQKINGEWVIIADHSS